MRRLNRKMRRAVHNHIGRKVASVIGGLSAFFGFVLMVGAAGNSDLNIGTFRDNTLMELLGLTIMFTGCIILKITDDSEYRERWIGAIGYLSKYKSYIKVVKFKDDRDWSYVFLDDDGEVVSTPIRTKRPVTKVRWMEVE